MSYADAAANTKVKVRMIPVQERGKQVIKSLSEILSNESNSQRYKALLNMPDPVFIGVLPILGQAQVVRHTPHLLGAIEPLRRFDFQVEIYFTKDPVSPDEVKFKQVFRDSLNVPIRIANIIGIQEPTLSLYQGDEQGWIVSCHKDRGLPLLIDFSDVCSAVVNVRYSFHTSNAAFSTTKQIRIGQLSENVTYMGYLGSGLRHAENVARQRAALHCRWPSHIKAVTFESGMLNRHRPHRSLQWDEAIKFLGSPEGTLWPFGHVPNHAMQQYLPDEQIWHERVKLLFPEGQYDDDWLPAVATLISVAPVLTLKDIQEFIKCCKKENIHKMSPQNAAMKFHYHPASAEVCMNALSTYSAEALTEPAGLLRRRFVYARRHHDQLCSRVAQELDKLTTASHSAEDLTLFPSTSMASTVYNCCTRCSPNNCNCKLNLIMPNIRPLQALTMQMDTQDVNSQSSTYSQEQAPTLLAVKRPKSNSGSTELQAILESAPAPTRSAVARSPMDVEMTEFQAELMVRQRKRARPSENDPANASLLSILDPDEPTRMKLIKLASDSQEQAPLSAIPQRLYDPPVTPTRFPQPMETCEPPADPILDRTKRLYPDIHQFLYPEIPPTDYQTFLHDMQHVRTWHNSRTTSWYKPFQGVLVRNEIASRTSMQFVFHHLRLIAYLFRKEWLKHLLMELPEMHSLPAKVRIRIPEYDLHDVIWPHLNQAFIREVSLSFFHSPSEEEHEDQQYPSHLDHLHVVISPAEESVIGVSFGYKRRKSISASAAYWASQQPPGLPDQAPPPASEVPYFQRAKALSHMTESDRTRFEKYVDDSEMDVTENGEEWVSPDSAMLQALQAKASACKQQALQAATTYLTYLEAPVDLSTKLHH